MKSIIILITLGIMLNIGAQLPPQHSLHGRILDAESGSPLADANVFLANTTFGASSSKSGHFIIERVPAGTFDLVVTIVGYETHRRTIRINDRDMPPLVIKLTPTVYMLPAVIISDKDRKEWRENLEIFKERLLSTSRNALKTEILNPLILEFERKQDNVLVATAREPLIIENRALGYKITYVLEHFEAGADYTKYSGEPKFEELAPDTPEQQKEWETNRRKAYLGSFRHFLTTICQNYELTGGNTKDRDFKTDTAGAIANDNTISFRIDYKDKSLLEHEGFRVLEIVNPLVKNPKGRLVNSNKFLRPGDHPNERFLKFPDYLEITYNKELEEDNFLHHNLFYRKPDIQRSWIKLLTDSVTIDIHGRYYDKFLVQLVGYWAWERLADMLPVEYGLPGDKTDFE